MLADYNVSWFEEPLLPDALEDYVALWRAAPVPISGGEVFTRRQSFLPRIGWTAENHGIRMIPHGWNTAIGLAADLQLSAAFPKTDLVEFIGRSPSSANWPQRAGTSMFRAC
jgi:L-alanine-DL-glutamate epimerase-like enolase superfamily enzyme